MPTNREMTDKETCPNAAIKGGRHCTCWPKEDCCACLEQPQPPIAEPAKAQQVEHEWVDADNVPEWCICRGLPPKEFCPVCNHVAAPQPQCKHGYARCFACPECEKMLPKPTPTVIPDARDEGESVLTDEQVVKLIYPNASANLVHGVGWRVITTYLDIWSTETLSRGCISESAAWESAIFMLPKESKPLPSEPQGVQLPDYIRRYGIGRDDEGFSTGNLVEANFGMYAGMIGVFRMAKELSAVQLKLSQLAAKPSEPAEGFDRWVKTRKRPGQFGYGISDLEAAWSAAKAEKVEGSWPRGSVTDKELADEAWNVRAREYQRDIATELQAYRELKKRSVGGVK